MPQADVRLKNEGSHFALNSHGVETQMMLIDQQTGSRDILENQS